MSLQLTSRAFAHEGTIPDRHTCRGDNASPPLAWQETPEGACSLALIVEDLDTPVGTLAHWVVFNISPESSGLPEGIARGERLPDGAVQGKNAAGRSGYMGPCPPWGRHRYVFSLYALDTTLDLSARTGRKRLRKAMEGHVLACGSLLGYYPGKR